MTAQEEIYSAKEKSLKFFRSQLFSFTFAWLFNLFSRVDELNAITLIFERARHCECFPSTIFALLDGTRRSGCRWCAFTRCVEGIRTTSKFICICLPVVIIVNVCIITRAVAVGVN
jgi:hypothetical protein